MRVGNQLELASRRRMAQTTPAGELGGLVQGHMGWGVTGTQNMLNLPLDPPFTHPGFGLIHCVL